MRLGVYRDTLGPSLKGADRVWLYRPGDIRWDLSSATDGLDAHICDNVEDIVAEVSAAAEPGDHVLIMSNSGFGGIHERLLIALDRAAAGR
jgi:UDP-N-acetylmuramate: L-alanyl-gamma-D-glutamyl-meso-diaminopimelate ligase